ncbi:hypothetical protein EXIGLDRAFT_784438 [Exidia glandulosa HHB12029]|uniref:Uncharacterized protein n=1 Tax=Exidia glandulosa HHB12029 TaxID=1314781 RepID=A0A166MGH1_EXIGL|nr:hypothetical protein EXIGLDRAFT_784438 [Exidia glandulosa HHB12029]
MTAFATPTSCALMTKFNGTARSNAVYWSFVTPFFAIVYTVPVAHVNYVAAGYERYWRSIDGSTHTGSLTSPIRIALSKQSA